MTDNEIIKGLMCHTSTDCQSCPFNGHGCSSHLFGKLIELISRLKVENESLKEKKSETFDQWIMLDNRTKERYAELYEEAKKVVRKEAIKDFAERFKRSCGSVKTEGKSMLVCQESSFDYLVKEMTEEK